MKTIYLCGPIKDCSDKECKEWREEVKINWNGNTLDPMRRDYRKVENIDIRELVQLDKADIGSSDIVFVHYTKPSVGTSMEILYANMLGKFVIVVNRDTESLSPWLVYHSHKIFKTISEAMHYLNTEWK